MIAFEGSAKEVRVTNTSGILMALGLQPASVLVDTVSLRSAYYV